MEIKLTHIVLPVLGFMVGLCINVQKAEAIGAQLENPTIKDMYFGFAMAGLISGGRNLFTKETLIAADYISTEMMKFRGKK